MHDGEGQDIVDEETILLTGPVTLYEVGAVRENLRAALAAGKPLRVDLGDSGPWDIAGLQLLVACARSAQEQGQLVRIVNPPGSCTEMARRSGLEPWLGSVGT